jgi:hypothetical protein
MPGKAVYVNETPTCFGRASSILAHSDAHRIDAQVSAIDAQGSFRAMGATLSAKHSINTLRLPSYPGRFRPSLHAQIRAQSVDF